jgi:ribonucleoside-diphosphate reductase alpha chain
LLITSFFFILPIKKTSLALQTFVSNKSEFYTFTIFIDNKLIHIITVEKKTYSYDEAYNASLEYFKGDELAARVWVNKYAVKDSFGNIYEKSPEDMHWRIANEVATICILMLNP